MRLGAPADLAAHIWRARAANPAGEQQLYADWQQPSMFSVQNQPLDNARYPGLPWTSAATFLTAQGSPHLAT